MSHRLHGEKYAPGIVLGIIVALGFLACAALADNPPSMAFVEVRSAGTAADNTGYGSVGHDYRIGKYEVTAGQYRDLLNDE